MDLLYFYAFAHQTSFDVRWMKTGSIASTIIQPLVRKLEEEYDLNVMPYSRVESIGMMKGAFICIYVYVCMSMYVYVCVMCVCNLSIVMLFLKLIHMANNKTTYQSKHA